MWHPMSTIETKDFNLSVVNQAHQLHSKRDDLAPNSFDKGMHPICSVKVVDENLLAHLKLLPLNVQGCFMRG